MVIIFFWEFHIAFFTPHFVCVSSQDVKTGIALFPKFARRHSIIRAAVDWQTFYQPARVLSFPQEQPFIFGTIACFKKQKNIFDLLKAFNATYQQNPHVRLEILGDGILRPEIEAWIAQHQLTQVIALHGWQLNPAVFMINWHAFVLSSLWEGLPCSVVEARLLKLPVLSYATGGIPDVISSYENGILVEQGDWQKLAESMLRISQSSELYTKLQGFNDLLTDFNDKHMIDKHMSLYKNL